MGVGTRTVPGVSGTGEGVGGDGGAVVGGGSTVGGTDEDAGIVVLVVATVAVVVVVSRIVVVVLGAVPGGKVVVTETGGDVVDVDGGTSGSQSRVTDAPALDTRSMCHANVAVAPTTPMVDVLPDPPRSVSMSSSRCTSPVSRVR
jgi:hypothetical protein